MKVYLAGPINSCTDSESKDWRQEVKDKCPNIWVLDPMVRDYRGKEHESASEIVQNDLADIDACDLVLANCWKASWGTAMEIFYAHRQGKRVLVIAPDVKTVSPWLKFHSEYVVDSLDYAIFLLNNWTMRSSG